MEGKEVLWLPGTDHAGIATQAKVERELREKEGKTRHDLGRDEFLKRVWDWKEKHGGIIIQQLKRLGCSCDWEPRALHDGRGLLAVGAARVRRPLQEGPHLPRQAHGELVPGLADRALRRGGDHEAAAVEALLHALRARRRRRASSCEIATTRPETLMGDTGGGREPEGPALLGTSSASKVRRPFPRAEIPIIADEHVDIEFGTGALKVTPAHDKADFEIGLRHDLAIIDVLTSRRHDELPGRARISTAWTASTRARRRRRSSRRWAC